jgi:hypothetical protein
MFSWIRSLVSAAAIVELHSRHIQVRDISHGRTFGFEPLLGVDGDQRVVSIGRPISVLAVKTYAPFVDPAAFAENRRIAVLLFQYVYSQLGAVGWLKPSPRILLRVDNDPSSAARLLNDESLVDLSQAAGARLTVVHRGGRLSDSDVVSRLDAAGCGSVSG